MAKKSKKDDRSALDAPQTAQVGLINQQDHPAIGLTPQRLTSLLIGAESGDLSAQSDLASDMEERDGHIFSELDKRKKAINGLPWQVLPPKNASEQEKKIAIEVAEWIDEIPNLELVFFDALDGILHGYSCQTIEWHKLGALHLPKAIDYVLPREFSAPFDQPNQLIWNGSGIEAQELWDFGWITHKHKAKSGYLSRSGLLRVLCFPYMFKHYGIKDILEFLEIYGLPIRVGSYSEGATNEEKRTLLRAVLSIGRDAGGIIPKGMKIDFQNAASGSTDNHMSLIKWCENTESKIIVGGTLLSSADGKTSTNAQSKTHEVQFDTIKKSDAKQLARTINDSLVSYLMRLNYPNITPDRYPKFKFDTSDTEDLKTFSDSLPNLVNLGMRISTAWAHERAGIPIASSDEPVLSFAQKIASNSFYPFGLQSLASNSTNPITRAELTALNGQNALDEQMRLLLTNQHLQNQSENLLPQLITKLSQAGDINGALTMLAEMLPDQDMESLQSDLEKLIFASDVLGRLNVNEGRKRG